MLTENKGVENVELSIKLCRGKCGNTGSLEFGGF